MDTGPRVIAGLMNVRGILGEVVRELGCKIVGGTWQPGDILPIEADMVEQMQVSRSVVREAIRILNAKGLVRSRQMEGTKVMPRAQWRLLDADVMQWRIRASDRRVLLKDLMQVRLVLEPGVVWAATRLGTPESRQRIHDAWRRREDVLAGVDVIPSEHRARFIEADLEFHRAFLAAAGSEMLEQLYSVIEAALTLLIDIQMRARGSVTSVVGMDESTAMHAAVYNAFCAGDADEAERATRILIGRAIRDANEGLALPELVP